MAGPRIRSIKPEWLDDEKMLQASPAARCLSVALIVLADDYGRGRGRRSIIVSRVFPGHSREGSEAFDELQSTGFFRLYTVRDQTYYQITNWGKHQKVDKPGKERIPAPTSTLGKIPESVENTPLARAGAGPGLDPLPGLGLGLDPGPDKRARKKRPKRDMPPGWTPNDTHRRIGSERGVDVEAEAEAFRNHAASVGRQLVDWDAGFRTWLGKARTQASSSADPAAQTMALADRLEANGE